MSDDALDANSEKLLKVNGSLVFKLLNVNGSLVFNKPLAVANAVENCITETAVP